MGVGKLISRLREKSVADGIYGAYNEIGGISHKSTVAQLEIFASRVADRLKKQQLIKFTWIWKIACACASQVCIQNKQ